MLRKAAAALLGGLEQRLASPSASPASAGAAFATAAQDYAVALKAATALVKPAESNIQPKEAGFMSGAPLETYERQALIYVPAKTASQSGLARTLHSPAPAWKLEFDTAPKWANPLMGWTSSADQLENVGRASLFFYTKEEAMSFCDKHGWAYAVAEPNERKASRQKRYNSYSDNFSTKRKGLPDLSSLPSNRAKGPE